MDKWQTVHAFWSSFDLPAYDSTSVPDDAVMPYITYDVSTGSIDQVLQLTASLWYTGTNWRDISLKADEIADAVGWGKIIPLDRGYFYVVKGQPFAQRMADPNRLVKRLYIVLQCEFMTP